jgi:magnesium-transporting ATPase (P-type)
MIAWTSGGWQFGTGLAETSVLYRKGTTMTFAGIVIAQVGNVLASRTNKVSLFKTSVKSNKWVWLGIAAQISIISVLVYVPLMQSVFQTTGLGLLDWAFLAILACIVVFAEETRKWLSRRYSK